MNLWWGGIFPGGGMSKFLAGVGDSPPIPPVRENSEAYSVEFILSIVCCHANMCSTTGDFSELSTSG